MKTKILKTEKEYNEACARVYELIHSTESDIDPNSEEGEEIELLSLLIEKYEQEHHQLNPPSPVEAIKFRMDQMNLKQSDVASLFGGKTRVSEVLNGKRALTLKMITLLNRYLGIPFESLIQGNTNIRLDSANSNKLLNLVSVKDPLKRRKVAI